jgi:hypothetical protein
MAWALVKNGTLLVRVGTVELPSPSAARYAMTNFDGAQHLVVAGHDPGSSSWRGLARVAQHRGECHVEVDRVAFNPSQNFRGLHLYFPHDGALHSGDLRQAQSRGCTDGAACKTMILVRDPSEWHFRAASRGEPYRPFFCRCLSRSRTMLVSPSGIRPRRRATS